MKVLSYIFITVGIICCLSIVLIFWGVPLIAVGALLRIAARPSALAVPTIVGTEAVAIDVASQPTDKGKIFVIVSFVIIGTAVFWTVAWLATSQDTAKPTITTPATVTQPKPARHIHTAKPVHRQP
jgi:predicted membrane protein